MALVEMEMGRLVSQGLLRQDDVDDRVREYLAAQQGWIVTQALTDFSAKDMSRINNKSNFLKGIVRKLLEGDGPRGAGGKGGTGQFQPPGQGHPPPHGYYPPQQEHYSHGHTEQYPHYGGKGGGGGGRGGGGLGGKGGGRY
jgi:hypothetical protein